MRTEKEIKKRIRELRKEHMNWKRVGLIQQAKAYEKAAEELEWVIEG